MENIPEQGLMLSESAETAGFPEFIRSASQDLFHVTLSVQDSDHLQWDGFGTVDDHIIGELRDGPEPHRQRRDILPLGSHAGMLCQPATGGKNLCLDAFGGVLVPFRDEPPNVI